MSLVVAALLSIELILILFFVRLDYQHISKLQQSLWRTLMIIPLLAIAALAYIKNPDLFRLLMCASLVLVVISDLILIRNFLAGLAVFMLYHMLNGYNFTRLYDDFSTYTLLHGLVAFAGAIAIYFVFFFKKVKGALRYILVAYNLVLAYALWRALMLSVAFTDLFSFGLYAGALLFFICDLQVAYVNFVAKITKTSETVNGFIYYGGLTLLALGSYFRV